MESGSAKCKEGSIVTYHSQMSTGYGGVETLIRSLQRVGLNKGLNVIELYNYRGDDVFPDNLKSVSYLEVPWYGRLGRLGSLLRTLVFLISLHRITNAGDFVFIFNPKVFLFMPVSFLRKRKVVLVQTNKLEVTYRSRLLKKLIGLKVRYLYRYCVYTELDKKYLNEFLFKNIDVKVSVIPRGCKIKASNKVKTNNKKVITIARIEEKQKNFNAMFEIFRFLPEFSLDIYGAGSKDEVDLLKEKCGTAANVNYRGPTTDVEVTLSDYSLFVMTSHYEGFGQTLIEARSQGLPIVMFDTFDAARWIVRNGFNGYLVGGEHCERFASRVKQLLGDDELFREMSANSLTLAKETDNEYVESLWTKLLEERVYDVSE